MRIFNGLGIWAVLLLWFGLRENWAWNIGEYCGLLGLKGKRGWEEGMGLGRELDLNR